MPSLSKRVTITETSPHRVLVDLALELKLKGVDVISFHAGQPGLPPYSEALKELAKTLLEKPFQTSSYAPSRGYPRLRELISEDIKKYSGISVDPEKQVLVTIGGAEAITISLLTGLDHGDKVLLLAPTYSVYWGLTKLLGVGIEYCEQDVNNDFQPDPECIKEKITRVKAVLFESPGNPTSRVISEEIGKLLVDLAVDHGKWILFDEAYKHIYYEGSHVWIQKYPGAEETVISIDSFSKDLAIPGFRLGYLWGNEEFINQAAKVKGYLSISASNISQKLAMIYLEKGYKEKYLEQVIPEYRRRRDAAYNAVKKYLPEAKLIKPRAGMYLFPDISYYLRKLRMTDVEFAKDVALKKHVVFLPGSAFLPGTNRYVRITFVTEPPERIEEGIKRVRDYLVEKGVI
ncbi:MAG: pyridoxal phosphate-dependent aminotransferase [Crenarchaeota archaeon]|nr:pyridoxal phosphate-dependent aminotransferase [Thermoproteota archaeon]